MARIKLTLSHPTFLIPLRQNLPGAKGKALEHGAAEVPTRVPAVAHGVVNQAPPIEVLRPQLHGALQARTQAAGEPVQVLLQVGEARQRSKTGGIRRRTSVI